MKKIYYAITPTFSTVTRYTEEGKFDLVYDKVMFITGDHNTAEAAAAWCELAGVGETYEHEEFTIKIIEDEE